MWYRSCAELSLATSTSSAYCVAASPWASRRGDRGPVVLLEGKRARDEANRTVGPSLTRFLRKLFADRFLNDLVHRHGRFMSLDQPIRGKSTQARLQRRLIPKRFRETFGEAIVFLIQQEEWDVMRPQEGADEREVARGRPALLQALQNHADQDAQYAFIDLLRDVASQWQGRSRSQRFERVSDGDPGTVNIR